MGLLKGANSLYLRTPAFAGVFVLFLAGVFLLLPPQHSQALTVNPKLELNSDPGFTLRTAIKVTNEERSSRLFYISYANFNSQDETGTPSFSTRREGLSTWIKSQDTITLGPGETAEVPIEISIPQDAEPGGHFAGAFFSLEPGEQTSDKGRIAIGSRLGSLILLRVSGDFVQNATIVEFNTTGKKRFFTRLPIQFYYRFQNIGDDHQKPLGDIQINNTYGRNVKILSANTVDGSVLPKSIRRFTSVWAEPGGGLKQEPVVDLVEPPQLPFWASVKEQWSNFAFGRYTAKLKVVYGTKELKSANSELVFYIIPWHLLSVAVPIGIVLLIILRFALKRYNRYIIAKAAASKN
jgi:hypothetical protein